MTKIAKKSSPRKHQKSKVKTRKEPSEPEGIFGGLVLESISNISENNGAFHDPRSESDSDEESYEQIEETAF